MRASDNEAKGSSISRMCGCFGMSSDHLSGQDKYLYVSHIPLHYTSTYMACLVERQALLVVHPSGQEMCLSVSGSTVSCWQRHLAWASLSGRCMSQCHRLHVETAHPCPHKETEEALPAQQLH